MPNITPAPVVDWMLKCFARGESIREVQRVTGVSRATVINYLKRWALDQKHGTQLVKEYQDVITANAGLPAKLDPVSYETLVDIVVTPKEDERFYPLLLYNGGVTMGRAQALWNFSRALKEANCLTVTDGVKFSKQSPDARHLLGLHAPVQNMSLHSWLSRLWTTPEIDDLDPTMREWLGDFAGGMPERFYWQLTKVPRYSTCKTTRQWRIGPDTEGFRRYRPKVSASVWPFVSRVPTEADSFVLEVDGLVPKNLPEQVRQDVCQDLIVSVLSGEISLPELKGAVQRHVKNVFDLHPLKYGPISLDHPLPQQARKMDHPNERAFKDWSTALTTEEHGH